MLSETPGSDPIRKNHAKNIQLFFNKTTFESLKHVFMDTTELETYKALTLLKPNSSSKRLNILKEVQDM